MPERHGEDRDQHEDRTPVDRALEVPGGRPRGGEGPVEEAQRDREPRRLRQHGEERRDRGRRSLVDVRAPEVEGHRGDLEAEAGQHQERDRVDREAVRLGDAAGQEGLDRGEGRGPRHPVEEGQAVEHRAGGGGAEEHVLERGLVRHPVALQVGHHHVGRDRDHLQGEVQHHEVARRREQQARQHEGEDERVELALAEALELARVAEGEDEDGQEAGRDQDDLERRAERVHDQHPGEDRGLRPRGLQVEGEAEGHRQGGEGQQAHRRVAPGGADRVRDHHEQQARDEGGLRLEEGEASEELFHGRLAL